MPAILSHCNKFLASLWHTPVSWSFLAVAARTSVSGILLLVGTRVLDPVTLGLWTTLLSFYALIALLDFALAASLGRAAAYAYAGASQILAFGVGPPPPKDSDPAESGKSAPPNWSIICALHHTGARVYRLTGAVLLVVFIIAWLKLAGSHSTWTGRNDLSLTAILFGISLAIAFWGGHWSAILPGVNRVREFQAIVAISWMVNGAVAGVGLVLGCGLMAMVSGFVAMYVAMRGLSAWLFRRIIRGAGVPVAIGSRDLLAALWPNMWRLAAIAIGSYLVAQFSVVACASRIDLQVAGSFGLSLQVSSMLSIISALWVQPMLPQLSQWRASHRLDRIAQTFVKTMRRQIATFVIGAILIISAGPALLQVAGAKTPLLPAPQLLALLLISFLETHHSQYACLVITENYNPFVAPALISGVAIALGSIWLAPILGVTGILLCQGVVQLSFNNWWPITRAIRGLNLSPAAYARLFISRRTSIT